MQPQFCFVFFILSWGSYRNKNYLVSRTDTQITSHFSIYRKAVVGFSWLEIILQVDNKMLLSRKHHHTHNTHLNPKIIRTIAMFSPYTIIFISYVLRRIWTLCDLIMMGFNTAFTAQSERERSWNFIPFLHIFLYIFLLNCLGSFFHFVYA